MRIPLSAIVCMILVNASAQGPARYAVAIDEVFADPTPSQGLPNASFIELRNLSAEPVPLKGWTLQVNNTAVRITADKTLAPDSLLILCSNASAAAYRAFGDVLPITSFPSLPDAGGTIALFAPDHRTIHAMTYAREDHANAVKQDGGWSLEMVDISKPCLEESNWISSTDPSGGTPGRKNSVAGEMEDEGPPHAVRTWTTDSTHIIVLFDRTMDSAVSVSPTHYRFSNGAIISRAELLPPLFRTAMLTLAQPLAPDTVLHLLVQDMIDCAGNALAGNDMLRAGVPVNGEKGSIVINELLFDPKPDGVDFVELLNTGWHVLDAARLSFGKLDVQGRVTGIVACSPVPFLIFPGDHFTMTSDPAVIARTFLLRHPECLSPSVALPSMPNDEGEVVLMDQQGEPLDRVHYQASWHFPLLKDVEGVSLERIDPHGVSQDPSNWHSAATPAGGGTPTGHNSQQRDAEPAPGNWSAEPAIFSPDMDGHDDVLTITYGFPQPGWSIAVTIYDRDGRPVRWLCRHLLCGNNGSLRWDGLDEQGRPPGLGAYIVVAEGFDLTGRHTVWRKRVSIAGMRR